MTWALCAFLMFASLVAAGIFFLIYVYRKEYDREQRIVDAIAKDREKYAATSPLDFYVLPVDSASLQALEQGAKSVMKAAKSSNDGVMSNAATGSQTSSPDSKNKKNIN